MNRQYSATRLDGGTAVEDPELAWSLVHKSATICSYMIWSAISLYCLVGYTNIHKNDFLRFPYITLTISVANAFFGLLENFLGEYFYVLGIHLEVLQVVLILPCITTEVWLKHNVAQRQAAWFHIVIALFPLLIYFFQGYAKQDLIDFTIIFNLVSLAIVGFLYKDRNAIMAGSMFFAGYYFLHRKAGFDLRPFQHFYNLSMAGFTYYAFKASA